MKQLYCSKLTAHLNGEYFQLEIYQNWNLDRDSDSWNLGDYSSWHNLERKKNGKWKYWCSCWKIFCVAQRNKIWKWNIESWKLKGIAHNTDNGHLCLIKHTDVPIGRGLTSAFIDRTMRSISSGNENRDGARDRGRD